MCITDSLRRAATTSFSGRPKIDPHIFILKNYIVMTFSSKNQMSSLIGSSDTKYTFNMQKHPDDVATIKMADSKGKVRVDEPISKLVWFLDETHHHYCSVDMVVEVHLAGPEAAIICRR